jgi:hypothetical protein
MALWLLQKLADIAKVNALKVADQITSKLDPFDEFTRLPLPKYPEKFSVKAKRFEDDFVSRFSAFDGGMWEYRITTDPNANDEGDQCIWHGIYTTMWALKYAATQNSADLERLRLCMKGLDLHQTAHGEPVRRVIRGTKKNPDGTLFIRDDVSNDGATGHICGIYFSWLYGDADIKAKAAILARGMADELINHHYALVLPNGNPTEFGALINGLLTDPLRLALCLCILKVASKITGEPLYEQHYRKVESEYNSGCLAAYAKAKLVTIEKKYDSHRAAICLSILSDIEDDSSLKSCYKNGLARTWAIEHKSGNTWIAFLNARHNPLTATEITQVKKMLSEFALENKVAGNVQTINSDKGDQLKQYGVRLMKWGGQWVSSQPLPRWMVGDQDFLWQRNLYSVDDWKGRNIPDTYHNGGDFLVAYWLGRVLGVVGADE